MIHESFNLVYWWSLIIWCSWLIWLFAMYRMYLWLRQYKVSHLNCLTNTNERFTFRTKLFNFSCVIVSESVDFATVCACVCEYLQAKCVLLCLPCCYNCLLITNTVQLSTSTDTEHILINSIRSCYVHQMIKFFSLIKICAWCKFLSYIVST